MQKVEKKKRRPHARSRWLLLGVAAALLMLAGVMYALASRPAVPVLDDTPPAGGELITRETSEVRSLRVTLRSGETWSAVQTADGGLAVEGDDGFLAADIRAQELLGAASVIAYEEVFTEDPALYRERLNDFGLEPARATVAITYADGEACTLRVGDPCEAENGRVYYMTVEGDDRLFALDRGTAEILITGRAVLRPVTQPTLHKARFDRITFANAEGAVQAQWELRGEIGGNAADRWLATVPVRYPADGEMMGNLLSNLANIRLGAYVAEANAENLTRYGLDTPRFTVTIHQAAGTIGTTDEEGRYGTTDWPESTFTLAVGGAKSEAVDYVLHDGKIYISSHYSLQTLMDMQAMSTVSRYPVPVALGNLARMVLEKDGERAEYVLTRETKTDADGESAVEITCTLNGEETPYAPFEAAYNRLLTATVSGRLPDNWSAEGSAHTRYTFEDTAGGVHTVALIPFDALHDAVLLDGCAMFYMIQGGLAWGIDGE